MRLTAALLAALLSFAGQAQLVDLPVTRIKVAPACEERTINWLQNATVASWTLEIRQVFSANGQPSYDAPTTHMVPWSTAPIWRGVIRQAGVYQVRVRANYVEDGVSKTTGWAESTDPSAALGNQSFVLVLFLCPPGEFEPN